MSEDNNVSNNIETTETTNVVQENITPNVTTDNFTTNASTPIETKKKNKALPICVVLLVVLCLGIGGFYFYFSTPKKIVTSVINKAYSKYDEAINKSVDFDIAKDSFKIDGDLNIDTNIPGFDKINEDKLNYTAGLDYKNQKVEGGLTLKESGKTLADVMAYIIDGKSYLDLGNDYKKLINAGEVDFEDIIDLSNTKVNFDKDDINYIVKSYKDILIDSIDDEDLEKSSDTIKVDGKDTKVNKVTYKLTDKKAEKLAKNIIDGTLNDKELLKKLAKVSGEDVDDIKDSLKDAKKDMDIDNEDLKMTLNIYTKGFLNDFVGLDINIDDDNSIKVIENKDNTTVTFKSGNTMTFVATIKDKDDEEFNMDYTVEFSGQKITGNLTVTEKETKKNNYKGSISFDVKYSEYKFAIKMNYTMEVGAKIADINTSNAVKIEDVEDDLEDVSETIINRLESSNLGTIISSSFGNLLGSSSSNSYGYYDDDDDDDYDFDFDDDDDNDDDYKYNSNLLE